MHRRGFLQLSRNTENTRPRGIELLMDTENEARSFVFIPLKGDPVIGRNTAFERGSHLQFVNPGKIQDPGEIGESEGLGIADDIGEHEAGDLAIFDLLVHQ